MVNVIPRPTSVGKQWKAVAALCGMPFAFWIDCKYAVLSMNEMDKFREKSQLWGDWRARNVRKPLDAESASKPLLGVINLGRMVYTEALAVQVMYQDRLRKSVESSDRKHMHPNTLILVEHPPVYTIGLRTGDYPKQEEDRLRALGADFVRTNRGGLITFHGFGQLVAYPIIYLPDFASLNSSVRCYVQSIEQTVVQLCGSVFSSFPTFQKSSPGSGSLKVAPLESYPGVWIDDSRKIAAIGVHTANLTTMHGVAINCNTDLSWYDHIVPCGIQGKGITSLSQEIQQDFTVGQTIPHFVESFKDTFNCDLSQEQEFSPSSHPSVEMKQNQS